MAALIPPALVGRFVERHEGGLDAIRAVAERVEVIGDAEGWHSGRLGDEM